MMEQQNDSQQTLQKILSEIQGTYPSLSMEQQREALIRIEAIRDTIKEQSANQIETKPGYLLEKLQMTLHELFAYDNSSLSTRARSGIFHAMLNNKQAARVLKDMSDIRVGDFVEMKEIDFLKTRNMGRKSISYIKESLEKIGLRLGMSIDPLVKTKYLMIVEGDH